MTTGARFGSASAQSLSAARASLRCRCAMVALGLTAVMPACTPGPSQEKAKKAHCAKTMRQAAEKRGESPPHLPAVTASSSSAPSGTSNDMALIPAGTFRMGTDDGFPYEGPTHDVALHAFRIDRHEVTVRQFAAFVRATGYRTDAEKFGWSGVFDIKAHDWTRVDRADWHHPDGPPATAADDEPVTQVSWNDAVAYAQWAGKRLPSEAEFEYAARGGLDSKRYAWGDEMRPGGKFMANCWQGMFPQQDLGEDGYIGRAPVGRFPPNGYGLYDMTGNVWEWCADWFDDDYYATESEGQHAAVQNPRGPDKGTERVIRGGSWLCSQNYCTGYRVAARSHAEPDSGLNNLGFRCVKDE